MPVVNLHEQPVGVLTLDKAMEFINDSVGKERLEQAGLRAEEDIFAPIWKSARNRWAWLAMNVCTAFISSRIIGAFEDTIGQLVALASLMPIVASISGNTGNQTVALTLRGLALKELHADNLRHVFFKELAVAVVNGMMWGFIVALFALAFYHQLDLALVIVAAMVLSLLVAALAGILIPVGLQRFGRNPVARE